MDIGPGQPTKLQLERCESGRIGLTANELTWVTGSEGSNPSLSARGSGPACRTVPDKDGPPQRARRAAAWAVPAWCEE
jgi:hypothetical protein